MYNVHKVPFEQIMLRLPCQAPQVSCAIRMQTMWRAYQAREGPQTPLGLQHRGASMSCAQGGRSSEQPLCMHLQLKGLYAKRLPSASLAEVCDAWTSLQGLWQPPLYLLGNRSLSIFTNFLVICGSYKRGVSICRLLFPDTNYCNTWCSLHPHLAISTTASRSESVFWDTDRTVPSSSRTLLPNKRTPDMSA